MYDTNKFEIQDYELLFINVLFYCKLFKSQSFHTVASL